MYLAILLVVLFWIAELATQHHFFKLMGMFSATYIGLYVLWLGFTVLLDFNNREQALPDPNPPSLVAEQSVQDIEIHVNDVPNRTNGKTHHPDPD